MAPITDSPELRQAITDARQLVANFYDQIKPLQPALEEGDMDAYRQLERFEDSYWEDAANTLECLLNLLP